MSSVGTARSQNPPASLDAYLSRIGVTSQERASVGAGRAVVKLLPGGNERDVAVFGILRVRAPRAAALSYFGDPARFLPAGGRKFHTFSPTPVANDVRLAGFDDAEYRDLRNCKPGDCDFKLPAAAMSKFQQEIDWSAADAKARADEMLRNGLLRLVTDYQAVGNRATVTYDDTRGARSGDVFVELAAQSPALYEYGPELQRYLHSYPGGRLEGARDLLYWAEDRVPRLRPTLTVNHVVFYTPHPDVGRSVIARKQIYASHYFEGAFEVLGVVDTEDRTGAYLVTVRRFRFDNLPVGAANVRGRVRSQLVQATRTDLEKFRSAIEGLQK